MKSKDNFFVKSMCSHGKDGKASMKRLITLLAFIMMCIGFIADLFWDKTITPEIYQSMMWIVVGGLGFTASEHFAQKTTTGIGGEVTEAIKSSSITGKDQPSNVAKPDQPTLR